MWEKETREGNKGCISKAQIFQGEAAEIMQEVNIFLMELAETEQPPYGQHLG